MSEANNIYPPTVDTTTLLYVCKRLVEAKFCGPTSTYEFECAWEEFKAIVDQLPEHL